MFSLLNARFFRLHNGLHFVIRKRLIFPIRKRLTSRHSQRLVGATVLGRPSSLSPFRYFTAFYPLNIPSFRHFGFRNFWGKC
ncbi:MAG: hypothetical protein FWG65_03860 [Turicibacter sp.]|nr:hypothetical protein [Turicibacter sp.]